MCWMAWVNWPKRLACKNNRGMHSTSRATSAANLIRSAIWGTKFATDRSRFEGVMRASRWGFNTRKGGLEFVATAKHHHRGPGDDWRLRRVLTTRAGLTIGSRQARHAAPAFYLCPRWLIVGGECAGSKCGQTICDASEPPRLRTGAVRQEARRMRRPPDTYEYVAEFLRKAKFHG